MKPVPRLVLAGTHSGTGKTSLSLALCAAWRRRGWRVQPFKAGPDFLDPTYLAQAAGRPCYNLDGWMMGQAYTTQLCARAAADADVALVEGGMGLFDGASPASEEGSTAELARWLEAPVVLTANAHGQARSLAATILGFRDFAPGLRFAGVIANWTGSEQHAAGLRDALAAAGLPPLLGAVPRGAWPELPSRHLGLVTASAANLPVELLDRFADAVEQHAPGLLNLASARPEATAEPAKRRTGSAAGPVLAVARDEAFHFYYPDNLEALEEAGARLAYFSPLRAPRLPEGTEAVYLGGGYPEEQAAELAANTALHTELRALVRQGGALYAECGGLLYLCEELVARNGTAHAMLGLLPARARMLSKRKALGYAEIETLAASPWGPAGARLRGHEFHYSELDCDPAAGGEWEKIYRVRSGRGGGAERAEGYRQGRVLASYVHLHWASQPAVARAFVAWCGRQA